MPRGARAAPPRRDRGRPRRDARRRRAGGRDRHLPGLQTEARRVGPRRPHARDQRQSRPDRAQSGRRARASSPARSARPASCPHPTTRRSATSPSARSSTSSPSRREASSRAAPTCSSSRPRRTSSRSRPRSSARARRSRRRARRCRSSAPSRCCPTAARCCSAPTSAPSSRRSTALDIQVIGLNCSTGPEDMRDAIRFLGELSPIPVHCIPNAGLPLQGPDGETIFPEKPEPLAASLGEFVERYGVNVVGGCCGTTPEHIRAIAERVKDLTPQRAPGRPHPPRLLDDRRHADRPGAAPDDRRRARQLAGLAQGEGDAAGRRLRRPAADRREPGRGRRAHPRPLRRADRAPGRGRADGDARQEGLALAARADPDRLDRARRDEGRAGADPRPRDRQLGQPRGRPRQARPRRAAVHRARRRADRADDRRGVDGEDAPAQGRRRPPHPRLRLRRARDGSADADLRRAHVHARDRLGRVQGLAPSRRSRASARSRPRCPAC